MKTENTRFDDFKKTFDENFGKVTPQKFIQQMEDLGYKFESSPSSVQGKTAEEIIPARTVLEGKIHQCYLSVNYPLVLEAMEEYANQFKASTPLQEAGDKIDWEKIHKDLDKGFRYLYTHKSIEFFRYCRVVQTTS